MSVLVKGMEMPENCRDCEFWCMYRNSHRMYCKSINRQLKADEENEIEKKRLSDCPLIEVFAPHGGLLDENDVIDAIHDRLHELQTHKEFQKKHGDIDLLGVMPYITKIQPVIEAEVME